MTNWVGGLVRLAVIAGAVAMLVSRDAAAQRLAPQLGTMTTTSSSTRDAAAAAGRRAGPAPRLPVDTHPKCGRDVACRIAEMKRQGTIPLLYTESAHLSALGGSRAVHATICVCQGAELRCLGPDTSWLQDLAPTPLTEIRIYKNLPAVSYLLNHSSVEFRIRWSTLLDSPSRNDRNSVESDGILTYTGISRPIVPSICRD